MHNFYTYRIAMYDVSHYSIWCTNSDKALAPPLATLPFPVRLDISLGGGESSLFCSNDPKVSKESTKLRIALPDFSAWFWDGHTVDSLKDHAPLAFLYVCIKCVWEYPFKKQWTFLCINWCLSNFEFPSTVWKVVQWNHEDTFQYTG